MKLDIFTITSAIFVIGALFSGFNIANPPENTAPPTALHQGVAFR